MLIKFRQHGQHGDHPGPVICIVEHAGEEVGFHAEALAGSDTVDHQLDKLAVLDLALFVIEGP